VNVLVHQDDRLHVDTFDLYQSRPGQAFINQASSELGVSTEVIKRNLGQVLIGNGVFRFPCSPTAS